MNHKLGIDLIIVVEPLKSRMNTDITGVTDKLSEACRRGCIINSSDNLLNLDEHLLK